MPSPDPGQSGSPVRHRPFVESINGVHYGVCPTCGWRQRYHFLLAARREVKVHRRYSGPNPRAGSH